MRNLILSVIFALGLLAPVHASVGGFLVNGAATAWGFCMIKKTDNKDVKWFVGVSASIFTIRAIVELVD